MYLSIFWRPPPIVTLLHATLSCARLDCGAPHYPGGYFTPVFPTLVFLPAFFVFCSYVVSMCYSRLTVLTLSIIVQYSLAVVFHGVLFDLLVLIPQFSRYAHSFFLHLHSKIIRPSVRYCDLFRCLHKFRP